MKFDSVETSSLKPTLLGKQRPQPERRKTAEEEGNDETTERVQGETRDSCGCGGKSEEEEEEERPSSSFQKKTTKEKTEAVEDAAISGLTGKAKTIRGNGEEKRKYSSTRRSEDVEDAVVGVDGGVEGMRTSMRERGSRCSQSMTSGGLTTETARNMGETNECVCVASTATKMVVKGHHRRFRRLPP